MHVIIAGAGPAGLLAALHLLRRNDNGNGPLYTVELVDAGQNYGLLDDAGLARKRSWMIGLSAHGINALQEIPGLWTDYVSKSGVQLQSGSFHLGGREIKFRADEFGESHTVDRNYIVAYMSRFLLDNYSESPHLTLRFNTKVCFVDGDNKRVLVRCQSSGQSTSSDNSKELSTEDSYLDYDLLIGCDGIRSVVRGAFVTTHRDFECSISDLLGIGKSAHVDTPKDVDEKSMHVVLNICPNIVSFILPEQGRKMNMILDFSPDKPCDKELYSNDASVIASYFEKHMKASCPAFCTGLDYEDLAQQWINQTWNTSGQVHCNFYHSLPLRAVLLGDAAHATSPQIGQGMNQAFADAQCLNELLDKHQDYLDDVLPSFSAERVKEGNALTWLSFYAYSVSASQQIRMTVSQVIRHFFAKRIPSLVEEHPLMMVSKGEKLSVAYRAFKRQGYLKAIRRVNEEACIEHFEKKTALVPYEERNGGISRVLAFVGLVGAAGIAWVLW